MAVSMTKFLNEMRRVRSRGVVSLAAALSVAAVPALVTLPTAAAAAQADRSQAAEVAAFYRARAGRPLWFSPSAGNAAQQLMILLATVQADGLNLKRHGSRRLSGVVGAASRG